MTKQTITIEAADPPEGLEYTGEYRRAEKGEQSILNGYHYAGSTCGYALILRKIEPLWVPPAGLKPGWVTNDRIGACWWSRRPDYDGKEHMWNHGTSGVKITMGLMHCNSPITGSKAIWEIRVGDDT